MRSNEIHLFGLFVHGVLSAFHTLGIVYNVRRRNWWDVAIHTACVVYDTKSAIHHYKEAK